MLAGIICEKCGKPAPRTGPVQRYCAPCSEIADINRKRLWARKIGTPRKRSAVLAEGARISAGEALSLIEATGAEINLAWAVRVAIPFDWAASKNHLYALRSRGHIALRQESTGFRDFVIVKLKEALRGRVVAQNKVWIDIFVQKPNHRGDAVNFIDLICDAVKVAAGVDDRWFSIRRVDWQVVKTDPQIYIGLGQETAEKVQICSSCGRALPFDSFQKNRSNESGISRNCRDCCSAQPRKRTKAA